MNKASSSGVGSKRRYAAGLALSSALLVGCAGKTADQYVVEAKAALTKRDDAAAVLQLKNALQENPSLAEARFLLGKTSLHLGDARAAIIELEKAKELGYADDEVVPVLAKAMLAAGQGEKLLRTYADTRLGSPAATADLLATLAATYNLQGKPAKAMELASAAVTADGGNLHANVVRIRLVWASAGAAEALKELNLLTEKSTKTVESVQLRGELLSSLGRVEEAIASFREALVIDNTSVAARAGLVASLLAKKDLEEAKKELDPLRTARGGTVQFRIFSVMLALEKNRLDEAREHALALLALSTDNAQSLYWAGVVEFRRGALLEADKHLSKAINVAPDLAKARMLLAQANLRAGNATKALTVLQPLLSENGNGAEALAIAGEAYLQQGDGRRAEEFFSRATKADPKSARSQVALALLQIARGKADAGLAALQTIAATDGGTIADMALVSTLTQRKDWDLALKSVDRLQSKMPGKPVSSNLRGRIELQRGNRDQARAAFEDALKLDPVYFPAASSLAELDLEDKRPEAAIARYEKILAVDSRNVAANMAVVALRAKAGASADELMAMLSKLIGQMPGETRPRLALVELQMNAKDIKGALATAQAAVSAAPESTEAWRFLAQVQALAGDGNQAISSFNKMISLQPTALEPYMQLAQLYTTRGDKANATATVKRALVVKPDYQPGQVALLRAELAAGNQAQALKIADEMRVQHPEDPLGYALGGDIHVTRNNWAAAGTAYRSALKLQPNVSELAIKLHRVLLAGQKLAEAKQFETEWLTGHSQDAAFLHYLGDVALVQKNYELAEQRYLAVLKLRPRNASAANNLAWVLNSAKKPGARAYAEMANQQSPNMPVYMDTLAQLLADAGELDKAIELQKRALSLEPERAEHRFHLARFYVDAGKKAEAREELQRLAALGSKFALQAEVGKLLEKL